MSDPKALPFEIWSLKTSLGQFGPKKALCNELIRPLDKNPSFNFLKRPHFVRNYEMNPLKSWNLKKFIDLGACDRKTIYIWATWLVGPEDIHKSRTLSPIFTNKTTFSQESCGKFCKLMKPQKNYWPCGLGSIGTTFQQLGSVQKRYPDKSRTPGSNICKQDLTFSRIIESRWIKMNPIKFWNVRKLIDLVGARGLETKLGQLRPRRCIQPCINPEPWLQYS